MKYMGSKNRISKSILPIILKERDSYTYYVEPFVGGCNLIDKVDGVRIGGDNNYFLISMWKGLQRNEERPHTITKDLYKKARNEYNHIRKSQDIEREFSDFLIGWIGWMGSYNGRFFDGGYSGHSVGKTKRNYISEQIRNTESQIDKIKSIDFRYSSYENLTLPEKSLIYCDIPYNNTKKYSTSKGFDYDKFWEWCRVTSSSDNKIFISEYEAPADFECVWEKELTNSMNTTKTYKPTEKLFTI